MKIYDHIDDISFPATYSEKEWQEKLTPWQYTILREAGTERAFSGEYNKEYSAGIYYSAATGQPLFSSEAKYDSGSGWPSFFQAITNEAVKIIRDNSYGMERLEVVDSSSGSHLGHLFNDGPAPTGLRFCLNSAALVFVPEGAELPPLIKEYAETYMP